MSDLWHPTVDLILKIHDSALAQDGGSRGVRSWELLESALSAPQASFGGEPIMRDAIEIAAAYLYYLCNNHPFVDGNKRVAMITCITFLKINGYQPAPDSKHWERLVLDVASSELDRHQTTARLIILMQDHQAQ